MKRDTVSCIWCIEKACNCQTIQLFCWCQLAWLLHMHQSVTGAQSFAGASLSLFSTKKTKWNRGTWVLHHLNCAMTIQRQTCSIRRVALLSMANVSQISWTAGRCLQKGAGMSEECNSKFWKIALFIYFDLQPAPPLFHYLAFIRKCSFFTWSSTNNLFIKSCSLEFLSC